MPATAAFCTISIRRAATDKQRVRIERQCFAHQHPSDDLVDGIVPPDIFGDLLERTRGREQPGGMKAARFVEYGLRAAQAARHCEQRVALECPTGGSRRGVRA